MKNMKLFNMQKESEKMKIKKKINECEDKKAQVLLQMGIKTYDKIRKDELVDSDFNQMCEEIKNIDIDIYMSYMKLKSIEGDKKKNTCECGYVAFKNEKFCPQCGRNLIVEEKKYIICETCNEETEADSNYCECCGNKINKFTIYDKYNSELENEKSLENKVSYENTFYEENKDYEITESIDDISYNVEIENNKIEKGKEITEFEDFEVIQYNNDYKEYVDDEETVEKEGREFLKNQQDNI